MIAALRSGFAVHVARPLVLVPPLVAVIATFLGLQDEAKQPHLLARAWAPFPLDLIGDFTTQSSRFATMVAFPGRLILVATYLFLLTSRKPGRRGLLGYSVTYAGGLLAVAAVFGLSVVFVRTPRNAATLLSSLGLIVLLVGLTSVMTPMLVRAYGRRKSLRMPDLPTAVLSAVSAWIWLFGPERLEAMERLSLGTAYTAVFVLAFIQSVLFAAIALNALGRSES